MDLIGLISGASSNLLDKVGDFSTAVDDLYKSSPLGKLEDTFTNSAIHKAFEGDPNAVFGGGGQGGSTHATVEDVETGYQDATSGLQNVMSQANILNPMAGMLRGGGYSDVVMENFNTFNPMPIQVAEAPSQQVDPALSEVEEIERNADEVAKKKQGMLMENPNLKPVPLLAE